MRIMIVACDLHPMTIDNDAVIQITDKSNEADWWLIGKMNINDMRMLNDQYGGRVH